MSPGCLTREQAHDLVDAAMEAPTGAARLEAVLSLQEHWIGHRDFCASGFEDDDGRATEATAVAEMLHEYVDESAFAGDDERSNGPNASDDTGLSAP